MENVMALKACLCLLTINIALLVVLALIAQVEDVYA